MKFLAVILLAVCLSGCKTPQLDPGGYYSPVTTNLLGEITVNRDVPLYLADSSFAFYYDTINRVFQFERNNRKELWRISPEVKHTLDAIRPGALDAKNRYLEARSIYVMLPATNTWTVLSGALENIRIYSVVAQEALTKGKP